MQQDWQVKGPTSGGSGVLGVGHWNEKRLVGKFAALQLFFIVLSVELWGPKFRNKHVRFHYDNLGVVQTINSIGTSFPAVVRWLSHLFLTSILIVLCLQGRQLGWARGEVSVRWLGVPGMLWSCLKCTITLD